MPDYGKIITNTTQAQANLAPTQYTLESNYQPAYGAVTAATLDQLLNGSEGGPQDYTYRGVALKNGWYDSKGQFLQQGGKNMKNAPKDATWYKKNSNLSVTGTINVPKTRGLISLYNDQNNAQRVADVNAIRDLGPLAKLALANANPEAASLVDRLTSQANEGLDAGSMMTGDQMRNLNSSLRSSMGARGVSYGSNASYQEALAGSQYGEMLRQQRVADAYKALAANQSYYGDTFQQILGRQSGANAGALAALGQTGPSVFNPNAANQLYAGAYQAQAQASAANAGGINSLIGAGIGAAGMLGASALMPAAAPAAAAKTATAV